MSTPTRPTRVLLTGSDAAHVLPPLRDLGFEAVTQDEHADFVIAYGGDGTLLGADRDFPNLPKLPIRRNSSVAKCPEHECAAILQRVAAGKQHVTFLPRLQAEIDGHRFYAINDIVFHNEKATSAVRYRVLIDGKPYSGEIIGDGLVVATPFGSSAYYRSITKSVTRVGIGLAFNNSIEAVNHLVLNESAVIEVDVARGPAIVIGDNMIDRMPVMPGTVLRISLSKHRAEIWELSSLTCKECVEADTGRPAGARHI